MNNSYRSDIDGLRAISVLLVVFYHAGFKLISGGFIGVDVFFVISGYLITGLILNDIDKGQFSFKKFYQRRVKRLMPALFFMLLVTSLVASLILLPMDLKAYYSSLISVVFSLSNFYFWRENGGYFDGNSEEVPLLHTWSLSVEEQFYFIWPISLLILIKLLDRKYLAFLLVALTLFSVAVSEWVTQVTFGAAYYLLPTRMFELLIGALLAIFYVNLNRPKLWIANLLSIMGLIAIFFSAIHLHEGHSFPGITALLPTLGAILVIYAGINQEAWITKLLSTKHLVAIGLISYSVYLWHWPIIVFINYVGIKLDLTLSLLIVFASLFLGWFSWKFVESPFRTNKITFNTPIRSLYLAPTLILSSLCLIGVYFNGFPDRFEPTIVKMESAIVSKPAELRVGCHSPSRNSEVIPNKNCSLGLLENSNKKALLIGDSHSNHLTGFMDILGKDSKLTVQDYTLDECIPVFNLAWGHNEHYSNLCRQRNDISRNYILENKFDYVILAGHWPTKNLYKYVNHGEVKNIDSDSFQDFLASYFKQTIKLIEQSGAKVVIVKDVAPSGGSTPMCEIQKVLYNQEINCDLNMARVHIRDEMMEGIYADIKMALPETIIIDPKVAMCDGQYCYSKVNNVPLYLDRNHLNDMGSRELAKQYLLKKENPFL